MKLASGGLNMAVHPVMPVPQAAHCQHLVQAPLVLRLPNLCIRNVSGGMDAWLRRTKSRWHPTIFQSHLHYCSEEGTMQTRCALQSVCKPAPTAWQAPLQWDLVRQPGSPQEIFEQQVRAMQPEVHCRVTSFGFGVLACEELHRWAKGDLKRIFLHGG